MVEFQPFGPKLPHDPEGTLEHERDVREEAERAHGVKRASETAHRSSLGYAIVLLGAALFVATCFLPYYGYESPGGVGVAVRPADSGPRRWLAARPEAVPVRWGCHRRGRRPRRSQRRERPSGRAFLAGAVAVWSLTWIGSLLQTASLRGGGTIRGLSLGGRLLAAGREHRRDDHRNHPGRYSPRMEPTSGVRRAWARDAGHSTRTSQRLTCSPCAW